MILECGHCGAPLDVKEGATTTRCRYCKSVNERQRMRTIATQTPRDFRPPKVWMPPPNMPMRADKPLPYQAAAIAFPIVISAVLGLVGVAVAIGIVASTSRSRSGGGLVGAISGKTGKDLEKLRIDQPVAGVAASLSVNASKTSVYVKLADPRFDGLSFSWDEKHPEHPTGFYFNQKSNTKPDPAVAAAISAKLHGGLENGNWHWAGLNVNVSETGGLGANSSPEITGPKNTPNPLWKEKLGAAWKIVLEALFGVPANIPPKLAPELIGVPYSFSALLKLDPNTPIDDAARTVHLAFPGAIVSTFIDLDAESNVDHPLFRDARLSWQNKKGGTMRGVGLQGNAAFVGKREQFVQCLTTKLGQPRVNDTDYVNKKRDYSFQTAGTWLSVSEKSVYLSGGGSGIPPEGYAKVVGAMDHCR